MLDLLNLLDNINSSRIKVLPEESKSSLSDASKKCCCESQSPVLLFMCLRVNLILKKSSEQERDHCHRSNGIVSWASHNGVN